MPSDQTSLIDTLRLTEQAVQKLAEALDRQDAIDLDHTEGKKKRAQSRFAFGQVKRLEVEVHAQGSATRYAVWARNLSSGGVSFLHGVFVCPGTPVYVSLQTLAGTRTQIPGKVRRSRLISGRVHEVGVQFDNAIETSNFVMICSDEAEGAPTDSARAARDGIKRSAEQMLSLLQTTAEQPKLLELVREMERLCQQLEAATKPSAAPAGAVSAGRQPAP